MALPFLLTLLVLATTHPRLALALGFYSERHGWDWVSSTSIGDLNASEFKDMATPLIQMCANTYRYPRSVPIQGWKPSAKISPIAPPTGGVHAVVYEEEQSDEHRVVIAFRGTQISDSLDSLADVCAGMLLWGDSSDFMSLPTECRSNFNESSLDYLNQAIAYTELAIRTYPDLGSVLLTGHSLGAGLAILVSMTLFERQSVYLPVIAFSSRGPGQKARLLENSSYLSSYDLNHVITIALEWDEVVRATWDEQLGFLCLYEQDEEPSSCQACFSHSSSSSSSSLSSSSLKMISNPRSKRPFGLDDEENDDDLLNSVRMYLPEGECWTCFLETHILKILINVVDKGNKPICQFMGLKKKEGDFVLCH